MALGRITARNNLFTSLSQGQSQGTDMATEELTTKWNFKAPIEPITTRMAEGMRLLEDASASPQLPEIKPLSQLIREKPALPDDFRHQVQSIQ